MENHWVRGLLVEVAQNKNYAGVILESPFTSMVNMGKKILSIFSS